MGVKSKVKWPPRVRLKMLRMAQQGCTAAQIALAVGCQSAGDISRLRAVLAGLGVRVAG